MRDQETRLLECSNTRDELKKNGIIGPWIEEPDVFIFKHAGLNCKILRNNLLFNLCGYVEIPKNHPYYGKDYHDILVDVHGGITFGEHEEEGGFWIGFDCAHASDGVPGMILSRALIRSETLKEKGEYHFALMRFMDKMDKMDKVWKNYLLPDTYKKLDYVIKETQRLAEQLSEVVTLG